MNINESRISDANPTANFRLVPREIFHFPIATPHRARERRWRRKCRSKFQPRSPVNATSKYVIEMRDTRGVSVTPTWRTRPERVSACAGTGSMSIHIVSRDVYVTDVWREVVWSLLLTHKKSSLLDRVFPPPPFVPRPTVSGKVKIVYRLRTARNSLNPSLFQHKGTLGKPDSLNRFFLARPNRNVKLENEINKCTKQRQKTRMRYMYTRVHRKKIISWFEKHIGLKRCQLVSRWRM